MSFSVSVTVELSSHLGDPRLTFVSLLFVGRFNVIGPAEEKVREQTK
jgi:hypothetical protein